MNLDRGNGMTTDFTDPSTVDVDVVMGNIDFEYRQRGHNWTDDLSWPNGAVKALSDEIRRLRQDSAGCPFCEIWHNGPKVGEGGVRSISDDVMILTPLNPVCSDHVLAVPRTHVTSFAPQRSPVLSEARRVLGQTIAEAQRYVWECLYGYDVNLITSRGPNATQTVNHLHVHLVPRRAQDGLHLPWTGQVR